MPGALFVVATPIGNLEDLTFRALRTLKEVDVIAAEDTRRTSKLLAHYGVAKPLVSLHEHNEHREAPRLVERMLRGESLALVSDAGTPAISDPGATLVNLSRQAALQVVAIPGPSAVVAALSVSGLPATPFTFLGFPPSSGRVRQRWFETLAASPGAVVFFESPHRIRRTLYELQTTSVERQIIVHREISKIHETWDIRRINDFNAEDQVPERGEYVIVAGPASRQPDDKITPEWLVSLFDQILAVESLNEEDAHRAITGITGLPVSRVRQMIKKERILVKRQNRQAP